MASQKRGLEISARLKFVSFRAAPTKYRLNREIAKKWNFLELAQNEVLRALVAKI